MLYHEYPYKSMSLTIYDPDPNKLSSEECDINTDEELFFSNPSDQLNLLYHINQSGDSKTLLSLGSLLFYSPFENQAMNPYSYYLVKRTHQPFDDPKPAYIRNSYAFLEKTKMEESFQAQEEEYPDWPTVDEHTYVETETHNGTTYVGLPFTILPIMYMGGDYATLDTTLYTNEDSDSSRPYEITTSFISYPKLSPFSDSEIDALDRSEKKHLKELQLTTDLIEEFEEMPNMLFNSSNMSSNAQSIIPYLPDLDYERHFEKNPTIDHHGLIKEDKLNQLLTDPKTELSYFEPLYGGIYYANFTRYTEATDPKYGTKELLKYLQEQEIAVLDNSSPQTINIKITNLNQIKKLRPVDLQSIKLHESNPELICKVGPPQ